MNYKSPNYNSWVTIPTVDIEVDNKYIENVFIGKEVIDNHVYVLINRDGSAKSIAYLNRLRENKNYVDEDDIDIDMVLLKFKVCQYQKDYDNIINGNFDKLSVEYIEHSINYLGKALANSVNGFIPFYEMLKMILLNDDRLLFTYWQNIIHADEWLLNMINDKGIYFSAPEDRNFFNKNSHIFSNN